MLCKMAIVLDQCESNFACMLSARINTTPLHVVSKNQHDTIVLQQPVKFFECF